MTQYIFLENKSIYEKVDLSLVGKQICIIPFERDFLLKYSKLEPTPLEEAESIDMPGSLNMVITSE